MLSWEARIRKANRVSSYLSGLFCITGLHLDLRPCREGWNGQAEVLLPDQWLNKFPSLKKKNTEKLNEGHRVVSTNANMYFTESIDVIANPVRTTTMVSETQPVFRFVTMNFPANPRRFTFLKSLLSFRRRT